MAIAVPRNSLKQCGIKARKKNQNSDDSGKLFRRDGRSTLELQVAERSRTAVGRIRRTCSYRSAGLVPAFFWQNFFYLTFLKFSSSANRSVKPFSCFCFFRLQTPMSRTLRTSSLSSANQFKHTEIWEALVLFRSIRQKVPTKVVSNRWNNNERP